MKDLSKVRREFTRSSKTWYHDARRDKVEIYIGLYPEEDGIHGEFEVEWYPLDNRLVPRLNAFDDAWKVLPYFQDLLDKLAEIDSKNVSEEDFAEMLIELGIVDITQYETPEKYKQSSMMEKYYMYLESGKKEGTNSERILFEILHDFTDRRGLRQEWEQIDEDIQNEILQKWFDIINK